MKKAIRILICALAVCLLASSCIKTTLNSILIGGKWELVHILTYDDANYATPIDTANLTDLILFLGYTDAQTGKKYHEVTTLKKY